MQRPILHGPIRHEDGTVEKEFLPEGHWLLEHLETHGEGRERRRSISCMHCNFDVYTEKGGSVGGWVETGFIFPDHATEEHPEGEGEAGVFCIHDYASLETWSGAGYLSGSNTIHHWMLLNDDGTPQPQVKAANAPEDD
jgi:hypothetical protein